MNYLYILVRTDMESLGRGKSVAQGAHAANAFIWDTVIRPSIQNTTTNPAALEWSREADGFGTTIALGVTLQELQNAVALATAMGFPARVVSDPTYPMLDGETLHIIPDVVTTGYVFGDKEALRMILGGFNLLRNDPV